MAYQIQTLSRFISKSKGLADVPFALVKGTPVTPREALAMLQRGEAVQEISYAISSLGAYSPQKDWLLAEDYYSRLIRIPYPPPKIYRFEYETTFEEALTHIRYRDAEGQKLVRTYQRLLREMARRMR